MTDTGTVLKEAFRTLKPAIKAEYTSRVRSAFAKALKQFGPTMKGAWNNWGVVAQTFVNLVKTSCDQIDRGPERGLGADRPENFEYVLSEALLEKNAEAAAEKSALAWFNKIQGKLGDLEEAKVVRKAGASLVITGRKYGREVRIEQTVIVKPSPRGLFFNQFPARIYVDGKFTSEAAFKKLAPPTSTGTARPRFI